MRGSFCALPFLHRCLLDVPSEINAPQQKPWRRWRPLLLGSPEDSGSSGTSSLAEVPLVPAEPHQLASQSTGCSSSSSSSSAPVAPSNPVSCGDATSSFLPQAVLDQLVSRVTTEVTKQLQPVLAQVTSLPSQLPTCAQPAQASTPGPSTVHSSGGYTTNIQDVVEVPAVQEGVQSVLASLSGETASLPRHQRPNDIVSSISLSIDARVPARIRNKIIQSLLTLALCLFSLHLKTNSKSQFRIQVKGHPHL